MATSLTLDQHLAALDSAGTRLAELATEAGMSTKVPSCPVWNVRALVAHQAMVHRWATAHVTGKGQAEVPSQTAIRSTVVDLVDYYTEGHAALLAALRAAPDDLQAMRFLGDAPPPREFWARRQAHETAIHMIDALAAALHRLPTVAEAAIEPEFAADGIDELVRGFFTRGRCKLYDGSAYTVVVAPSDVDRQWVLHIGPTLTVDADDAHPPDSSAAVTLTGTAAALYLGLWNRGDELVAAGASEFLPLWRASNRVRWS